MAKAGKQKASAAASTSTSFSATYGGDFLPLAIQAGSSKTTHYLYVRPQAAASETSDRSLFVSNLPVDFGDSAARGVFSRFGVIENVQFGKGAGKSAMENAVLELSDDEASDSEGEGEDEPAPAPQVDEDGWTFVGTEQPKRRRRRRLQAIPASVPEVTPLNEPVPALHLSGRATCTITFLDAVSVPRVMKHSGTLSYTPDLPTGLSRYEAQYTALRPKMALAKAHADSAMERYDHLHSLLLTSKAKAQGAGAVVDADGFTVVLRSGRYGRTAGRGADGAGVAVASFADANKTGKKKKHSGAAELKDFYRFQAQDRKKKELAEMRRKFEQDRQKVAELKKGRRYKPY